MAKAGQKIFSKNNIWRYGGEEIVWALDGTEEQAIEKAEQFRKYCEEKAWLKKPMRSSRKRTSKHFTDGLDHKKGEVFYIHYPVTISQAIVQWVEDGTNLESIITAADNGLYAAKDNGRNTVVFRGVPRNVGLKPVKYTPEMLEILHQYSLKKGSTDWWSYREKTSEKAREEALEFARNTLGDKEVRGKK